MSSKVQGSRHNIGTTTPLRSDKRQKRENRKEERPSADTSCSYPILAYFPSCLFGTILEDTIIKIRILIDCNIEGTINSILVDIDSHIKKKYGITQPAVVDLEDFIGKRDIEADDFKMFKMSNDRAILNEVLIDTYKDLVLSKNYMSLINKIQMIADGNKHYAMLQLETEKNKIREKELARCRRNISLKNETIIHEADVVLDKLEKSIEDISLTQMTRSRHVDNWECARREQHVDTINKIENVYGDSIRYYMNRMKKELIVHHEIEALVNININETLDEIQMWIEKYDKDTETIGLNIQTKRILYLDKLSRRMDLEEMIKLHEKEVWDWTEFKRKRAEAQKYFSDMTRCAVMIQAWWRGLLVRKQLGPFKVDKKKKRKKK